MSSTPNPRRRAKSLGRALLIWKDESRDRVETDRGSMSFADYEVVRTVEGKALPPLDMLPTSRAAALARLARA